MIDLAAIRLDVGREQIALELAYYNIQQGPAYVGMVANCAALLAEVDRLKGLCGRAAEAIDAIHEAGWAGPESDDVIAGLKDATK